MPSEYILPNEYAVYGLPTSTTQPQVYQASLLIDAYLRRPEGLVYYNDFLGLPAYMIGLEPTRTWNSLGSIAPGKSVVVPLTVQVPVFVDLIGEVVILDRGTGFDEACVITNMATGQITLGSVLTSHSADCTIDFGMTILEERPLPAKRSIARVARPPVRLLSGLGRYAYGRRTDQTSGMFNEVNLLAAIQAFGGPPMWNPFDVSQADVSEITREIWIPAGILLAYYSDVRLRYISGYTEISLPPIIKQACATIIVAAQTQSNFQGQLKSIGAGTTKLERFAPSVLDRDVMSSLNTFRCVVMT